MVRLLLAAILLASFLPVSGEAQAVAQLVSNGAIFLLFLLNGLRLPRDQVLSGIGNLRFLVPLILWSFGAIAMAGWGLSVIGAGFLPPMVALGFLYLGTLPSTVQSATAYSSLAGGNVASSVVAAALLNILGVFITAPLFSAISEFMGSNIMGAGIDASGLAKVGLLLLLPFTLGQIAQHWAGGWMKDHKRIVKWMDRTSITIAVYVAFSAAVEQGIWGKLNPLAWGMLLALVLSLLIFAFGGAWLLGGVSKLERGDRIAMLFAGGQKSIAMGAPLATVMFPPAMAGIVLLPVLAYHLLQLVISAPLAARLARG